MTRDAETRAAGSGSYSARLSLGLQLKAHRLAAKKSLADFEAAGFGSTGKIRRIEGAKSPVGVPVVMAMCELYGVDETTKGQLMTLAKHTNDHGWWEPYGGALQSWFATYIAIESAARVIRTWDPMVIHGLLQTPAYQRALFETHPDATADYAEEQVRLRSARQRAAFDDRTPLEVQMVVDEGVLHRLVGGEKVAAEQLEHLVEMSQQAHVDVRVLPFAAGAHVAINGAFMLIEFDEPLAPDTVYLETHAGGRYVEDNDMTSEYRTMFDAIQARSIPIQEYKP